MDVQHWPNESDVQHAVWDSEGTAPHTPVDTEALKALLLRALFIATILLGLVGSASTVFASRPGWTRAEVAPTFALAVVGTVGLLLSWCKRHRFASVLVLLSGMVLIFGLTINHQELSILHYLIIVMSMTRVFWGEREMRWLVGGITLSILALPLVVPAWTLADVIIHGLMMVVLAWIMLEGGSRYLLALEHQRQAERFEHEAKYRRLIESAPMGVIVYVDHHIVYANPAALDIVGASALTDVLGLTPEDVLHPDFHAERGGLLRELEQTGKAPARLERIKRFDGTLRDVEILLTATTFGGQQAVQVFARDITEHRRAESALQQSEARLRAIFSAIPDLLFILNRDGQIIEISAQESDLLMMPAEQMLGRSLAEVLPPEIARLLTEAAHRTLNTGRSQTVEYALDLPIRSVYEEGRFVLNGGDEVLLIVRDITERKRSEEALHGRDAILMALAYASEQLLRSGSLDDVLPEVLARLGEAMQAMRATIFENHRADDGDWLMSERCGWLAPGVQACFDRARLHKLSYREAGFGAWPETLGAGGVLVGPVWGRPESERSPLRNADVESLLVVPIFAGETWWGFLGIDSISSEREWSPIEVEAVRNLAGTLGAAIVRQHTEALEREQRRFIEALRDTAALISSTLDLDEVLDHILASLAETIHHDAASIVLLSEGGALRLAHSRGYGRGDGSDAFDQVLLSPAGMAQLRQVLDGAGPVITPDLHQSEMGVSLPGAEWVRAHLVVPLEFDGQTIGVLSLASATPDQYTATHTERAQAFASQAAMAIHNAQLFDRIQHHANALETLRRFGLSISAELDLDALLQQTLKNALELLGVTAGGVFLYRPERDVLEWVVGTGSPQLSVGSEIQAGACVAGAALRSGQVQVVNDFSAWDGVCVPGFNYDGLAMIAAPINRKDQVLGVVVGMANAAERTFAEQDARLLRLFGNQASIAIQNAQLFKAEREQRMLAEALRDVAAALGSTPNMQNVFQHVLRKVGELIPYDAADIMLVEGGIGRVVHQQGYERFGVQDWILNARLYVHDDPELHRIVEQGEFSLHDTVTNEPGWRASMLAETRIFQSYVAVPMFSEGRVIGVVTLASSAPARFSVAHADWLRAFANQAAIALENARLYAELSRHVEEMAALHRGTSFLFASLSSPDLEDVGAEIAKALAHEFADADCAVLLVDEEAGCCLPLGRAGAYGLCTTGLVNLNEPSLVAEAVHTRSQVYRAEMDQGKDWAALPDGVARSELVVPVVAAKGIIAALHLRSAEPHAFSPQDRNILAAFAERVAAVLENRQLYDEIRRHSEELERHVQARTIDLSVRNAVAETLSSSLDMNEMLTGVLQTTVEELHVLGGAIYLLGPESDTLELAAHCGISTDALGRVTGITPGSADLSVPARPRAQDRADLSQETGISAVLSVPIWRREHIRGIITLVHDQPRPWRSEETRMLDAIGRQIGVALANAESYAEAVRGEAHIRTILQSVADGLLVFDAHGNLALMNPAAEALFAFYPPDVGGPLSAAHHLMAWLQAHHELKAGPVNVEFALPEIALAGDGATTLAQCVGEGCAGASREEAAWPCWLKLPQDAWTADESCPVIQRMPRRSIRAHSADISDTDGTDLGVVIVLHDVTYFRELDDLKGRFVSTVSHELRTPLTAILLQISTLLKYYHRFEDMERFEMLTEMQQQATILRELIEDILDLSRFDSKRNLGEKRWMNLAEQCRGVLTSLRPVCEEKALALEVTGLDAPCFVDGDAHQLERVCRNLLGNAIKYTPEGGRIAVTLGRESGYVRLKIADSGIGIASDELPYIFDRFFRSEQASRIASGTGLGLAIVKEIVDQHGGRIEVQSTPGQGSTFTVLLPTGALHESPDAMPDPQVNVQPLLPLDNG